MISWISVKDMIPDAFVSVLIFIPDEYPLQTVHEGYYANEHWYWYFAGGQLEDGKVTYWSPMPEGPKTKEILL